MPHVYGSFLSPWSRHRPPNRNLATSNACYQLYTTVHHARIQPFSAPIGYQTLNFFNGVLHQSFSIQHLRQIHAQIVLTGAYNYGFVATQLVSAYSRFGFLNHAWRAFETTLHVDTSNMLLWNSSIRACISHRESKRALELYVRMGKLGFRPDGFTLPLLVRACSLIGIPRFGMAVHSHVVQMGFHIHLHTNNELIGMYGKLSRMDLARQLFDRMPHRNHISWNSMVSGFAFNYSPENAMEMVQLMESEQIEPTPVTWTSLLSGCSRCVRHRETMELFRTMRGRGIETTGEAVAVMLSSCAAVGAFKNGKAVHGYIQKMALDNFSFVRNSLISLYGKNRCVKEARDVFLGMESKNSITWNSLISSLAEAELCDEALQLLVEMDKLCENPNVISWTAVINGFASSGRGEECLKLFHEMQCNAVKGNSITLACVLSVCAEFAMFNLGREIHSHAIRASMEQNVLVANGLINVYMKCGRIDYGRLVFGRFDRRDVISWNIMIDGYGMHGFGEEALETFDQMIGAGVAPDEVTFVAVLSACSHSGLVEVGRYLFSEMRRDFEVEPQVEHYACLVDLLGRGGFVGEACEVVKSMPVKPNAYVWGSLLSSCRTHEGNAETTERIVLDGFGALGDMTGSYMLLSSIYALNGRWNHSARVRMCARNNGLKKMAGQSWIEVKNKTYSFSAGKTVHDVDDVYGVIEKLSLQMKADMAKNIELSC